MRNFNGANQLGHILSESVVDEEKRRGGKPGRGSAFATIQREILQEIASHAGRYGHKLTELITLLKELEEKITLRKRHLDWSSERDREAVNREIERFNAIQQEATKVQHHLIIHREAMGLWAHHDVFRLYPVPPALSLLVHDPDQETAGEAGGSFSCS
jgi:hypothetical protein